VTLLISVVVIVGNAVADALYVCVDPRIRLR
jgi:ABC-type dipeptide/oligopeptide/nickel transport system permease component